METNTLEDEHCNWTYYFCVYESARHTVHEYGSAARLKDNAAPRMGLQTKRPLGSKASHYLDNEM